MYENKYEYPNNTSDPHTQSHNYRSYSPRGCVTQHIV